MNKQQKKFCELYIKYLNGSKAYKEAYKTSNDNTAKTNAYHLFEKPEIQDYIETMTDKISEEILVDATYIRQGIKNIYERSMEKNIVVGKDGEPTGFIKFDGKTALECLKTLGKDNHNKKVKGMFSEKMMLGNDPQEGPIQLQVHIEDLHHESEEN